MKTPAFLTKPAVWWTLLALWALTVIALSSLTGAQVGRVLPNSFCHKVCHVIAFGSGAIILATALRLSTRWNWLAISLTTICAISLFGASDEWHQLYTPGRGGGSKFDWSVDTAAAILGTGIVLYVKKRFVKNP